jgi:membrane protein DedA with SNARE-associated domain
VKDAWFASGPNFNFKVFMLEWITGVMNSMGYIGIVFLMFLENVFPPIPSELVMPFAGFTAAQGKLSLVGVILAGMAGSVLGSLPLYYAGKLLGEERLKSLADRYGKWLTVSGDDIEKAKRWFDRHGNKAVFFCRLIPGIRSLISLPAGMAAMPLPLFLLYSAIGTGLWAGLLAWLGSLLGDNYDKVARYLGPATYVILGALLCAIIFVVVRRKKAQTAQ